jgi:hypothetical protein
VVWLAVHRTSATFRNVFTARAGVAALHIFGGNTNPVTFTGGSAYYSPVGVKVDDGGAVFTGFFSGDCNTADFDIADNQAGLSLFQCHSENNTGEGVYLRTSVSSGMHAASL